MATAPTPTQLSGVIRYHLEGLGSQNAHHAFEHLARHIARARLYSNLLPATGPVSAGGDGGRDFETFRTGLTRPLTANAPFVARSSGERDVAFACSLERKIGTKIRADVRAILADGPVDEIIYFCGVDLAIGNRRKLQKWARDDHQIDLRIFDGQAVSEWLAEPDLFWIAQQYLNLPADLAPTLSSDEPYLDLRARWKGRDPVVISRADFREVKAGVRRATFDLEARPDLLMWLEKLEVFLASPMTPRPTVRDVIYEIAVASLRGLGDLTPQAHRLRDYYSDASDWVETGELQNAATLLVYAFGGRMYSTYRGPEEELIDWTRRLIAVIDDQIANAQGPVRLSGLYRVRGHLSGLPTMMGGPNRPEAGLDDWNRMLDEADKTRLFPVEDFADFLATVIAMAGPDGGLLKLAARTDDLVAERAGAGVAAEKAFERAMGLLEHDHELEAIDQLHRAKGKWFSGDRISGSVRVMLLLADAYRRLGLVYASKYYALAAAFLAQYHPSEDLRGLIGRARMAVADAEDAAGCAIGFVQAMLVTLGAHIENDMDPLDPDRHPDLHINLGQMASWRGILKRLSPGQLPVFDRVYALWPPLLTDPIVAGADSPTGFWMEGEPVDAWSRLATTLLDRPFGDFGRRRIVQWRAFGFHWRCEFENTYATLPEAEQFIAQLQLFLVVLRRGDFAIPATDVVFDIVVDATLAAPVLVEAPASEEEGGSRRFEVRLPTHAEMTPGPILSEVFMPLLTMLSVLSFKGLQSALPALMPSLAGELFVARPYAELYRDLVPEALFNEALRHDLAPIDDALVHDRPGHPALDAPTGPGPGYDREEALLSAQRRYDLFLPYLRYTLPRLLADEATRARIEALRAEGLPDWEILGVLANVAMNHRLGIEAMDEMPEDFLERAQAEMGRTESEDEALAPAVFTQDRMDAHRLTFMTANMAAWRLRPVGHRDMDALRALMAARYGFRRDDVDHPPIFQGDPDVA